MANPKDELMHPIKGQSAWSESYYFNFVDPESKLAIFTRMGWRPGDGWADALHVVYLGGDRVAFTYGRRNIEQDLSQYNGDLSVGHLTLGCEVPFDHWTIKYAGPAQDIADAAILLERSKLRPDGWFKAAQLDMKLDFKALHLPHYAAAGDHGHFEQTGAVSGSIKIDDEVFVVNGHGVRDKSWGPRDWGAGTTVSKKPSEESSNGTAQKVADEGPSPFVNWFSMNFGADLAMGGSCFRRADGQMLGSGWIQIAGKTEDLKDVAITSEYKADSILHQSIVLTGTTASGRPIHVDGNVLTICPTKIPMPGGATFINEGLAEFTCAGKIGYGISEHWHRVSV
jgi:hypothetical protein